MTSRPHHLLLRYPLLILQDPSSFLWPWKIEARPMSAFKEQGYQIASYRFNDSESASISLERSVEDLISLAGSKGLHLWGSLSALQLFFKKTKPETHSLIQSINYPYESHLSSRHTEFLTLFKSLKSRSYEIKLKPVDKPMNFWLHSKWLAYSQGFQPHYDMTFYQFNEKDLEFYYSHFIQVAEDDFHSS